MKSTIRNLFKASKPVTEETIDHPSAETKRLVKWMATVASTLGAKNISINIDGATAEVHSFKDEYDLVKSTLDPTYSQENATFYDLYRSTRDQHHTTWATGACVRPSSSRVEVGLAHENAIVIQFTDENGRWLDWEDLRTVEPKGVHIISHDVFNNGTFRMPFPITKKMSDINWNAFVFPGDVSGEQVLAALYRVIR